MYESPVQKLVTEIETDIRQQEENAVLQAVVSVGVNVDKEELIKALEYDRGQYEKGYADGCRDSRKHGRWETANDGTHFCSNCGCDAPYTWDDIDRCFTNSADDVPDRISNYCPRCGAQMDGGNEDE